MTTSVVLFVPLVRDRTDCWDPRTRRNPGVIGLERQTKLVVEDSEVTVAAAHDRLRHERSHFLRHDADIGCVAAVVSKAIEAKPIVDAPEQHDVVLKAHVRAPTAAATAPAAATAAAGHS